MFHIIAHLANQSFTMTQFPSKWKSGLVMPLLKKPRLDVCDQNNFQLIINLTTTSKILERLALSHLKPQITSSRYYCVLQSAYRATNSTEKELVKVVDNILRSINFGLVVALVDLDISAAFNTVNHDTLLCQLQSEFGVVECHYIGSTPNSLTVPSSAMLECCHWQRLHYIWVCRRNQCVSRCHL